MAKSERETPKARTFRWPSASYGRVREYATRNGVSVSHVVRTWVGEYLNGDSVSLVGISENIKKELERWADELARINGQERDKKPGSKDIERAVLSALREWAEKRP